MGSRPSSDFELIIDTHPCLDSCAFGLVVLLRSCFNSSEYATLDPRNTKEDNMPKRVVIIPGDDAAPEAMAPAVAILKSLNLDIAWTEFPSGEEGVKQYGSRQAFDHALRE